MFDSKCASPVDIHHVLSPTKALNHPFLLFFFSILPIAACCFYLIFFLEGNSIFILVWSLLISLLLLKLLLRNPIKKGHNSHHLCFLSLAFDLEVLTTISMFLNASESVLIMPTFGVQLETHYLSGRVSRRFIPVDKILKPVLLECVTPITCYWNLCLILRGDGEEQLTSVFKGLRPPAKMLGPIWKALCAATGKEEERLNATA